MRQVFIDTNFVVQAARWRVDVFSELQRILDFRHEVVVLDKVLYELEKLKAKGGKDGEAASVALIVLKRKNPKVVKTGYGRVDDLILKAASSAKGIIATQDQALKRRAKAKGLSSIVIRQKSHLALVET